MFKNLILSNDATVIVEVLSHGFSKGQFPKHQSSVRILSAQGFITEKTVIGNASKQLKQVAPVGFSVAGRFGVQNAVIDGKSVNYETFEQTTLNNEQINFFNSLIKKADSLPIARVEATPAGAPSATASNEDLPF